MKDLARNLCSVFTETISTSIGLNTSTTPLCIRRNRQGQITRLVRKYYQSTERNHSGWNSLREKFYSKWQKKILLFNSQGFEKIFDSIRHYSCENEVINMKGAPLRAGDTAWCSYFYMARKAMIAWTERMRQKTQYGSEINSKPSPRTQRRQDMRQRESGSQNMCSRNLRKQKTERDKRTKKQQKSIFQSCEKGLCPHYKMVHQVHKHILIRN